MVNTLSTPMFSVLLMTYMTDSAFKLFMFVAFIQSVAQSLVRKSEYFEYHDVFSVTNDLHDE